nr:immunoglobulin heavy chain junction region [Macaca mulatta]MOV51331.1 immunoglobulin heavy chain junction region [Macaca mulatta]
CARCPWIQLQFFDYW